jgi:hypothetical protein
MMTSPVVRRHNGERTDRRAPIQHPVRLFLNTPLSADAQTVKVYPDYHGYSVTRRPEVGDPFSSQSTPDQGANRAEILRRQYEQRYQEAKTTHRQPTTPLVIPSDVRPDAPIVKASPLSRPEVRTGAPAVMLARPHGGLDGLSAMRRAIAPSSR